MDRPLNDTELRAAASQRPNYATYPEYRRQPERLAPYWRGVEPDPLADTVAVAELDPHPDAHQMPAEDALVEFVPTRILARPWWRPRWHWLVITRGGFRAGYAWTYAGARRCTVRAVRSAGMRDFWWGFTHPGQAVREASRG